MPIEKANYVLHDECIEPWLAVQIQKKNLKIKKHKLEAQLKDKRETKAKLMAQKTRGYWIERAQVAFNQFIRLRDRLAGHACISSGVPLDWTANAVDAGHYRSRGSAPHLRFDERNCHAQSKRENRYLAGNVTGYRRGLIQRYGVDFVEALESDQSTSKWSIAEIQQIEKTYKARAKQMAQS
jgi:hypothetical protein